ncbi:UNVERIFIED_CONTAM: hypothetical protein Cloal_0842 [Acetivibrio alkalicellulosi]
MTKKIFILFALVVLINSLMLTTGILAESSDIKTTTMSTKPLIGDIDGNGYINSTDLVYMRRYLLEIIKELPVEDKLWVADLNGDNLIDSIDYILLRRRVLNIISVFPKEQITPPPAITPDPDEGWTVINPASDSRIIYVSSSTGNDSNDGLSPDSPVETLTRASALMRDGYPDHMLLKRGDVWKDQPLGRFKSGRSESEPMVISYYGESGNRPLIKCSNNFIDHAGRVFGNFALIGLELVGYRMDPKDSDYDPSAKHPIIRLVGGGDNILIEDCKLKFMEIVVQGYDGNIYRNFKLRRNIIIDVYSHGTTTNNSIRPSGIYASNTDGLLIEENVFDHNGWNADIPEANANMYNHNIYLQVSNVGNKVVVRGNIITRGSSHGIHGRPGGLYEDNLLVLNAISLQLGYKGSPLKAGTFAIARNNVILNGRLMDPNDSAWPRTRALWGIHFDDIGDGDVRIERNIVANRRDNGVNNGIKSSTEVKYINNIQYNWGGGIGDMTDTSWPDPDRSIESYHGSLGKTPTFEAFIDVVRNRGLKEWPLEYTAYAVNEYIRQGFDLVE